MEILTDLAILGSMIFAAYVWGCMFLAYWEHKLRDKFRP